MTVTACDVHKKCRDMIRKNDKRHAGKPGDADGKLMMCPARTRHKLNTSGSFIALFSLIVATAVGKLKKISVARRN